MTPSLLRNKADRPVCVITGVGDATGSALVRRFTESGYDVAMIARARDRLSALEAEIETAHAFVGDVADLSGLERLMEEIGSRLGSPSILIHNAVSHSFDRFQKGDTKALEDNFRVNTTALLRLSQLVAPDMIEAGRGAIIATGNTASYRGVPNYALFAPTKAAQRVLAEAMARDLGPQGIHVAYLSVDAAIDVSWLGEKGSRPDWLEPPEGWTKDRSEFFSNPDAIASEVFHLAHQHKSTWTFDVIVRPFAENW